jgi:hypothetical protein
MDSNNTRFMRTSTFSKGDDTMLRFNRIITYSILGASVLSVPAVGYKTFKAILKTKDPMGKRSIYGCEAGRAVPSSIEATKILMSPKEMKEKVTGIEAAQQRGARSASGKQLTDKKRCQSGRL